MSSPKVNGAQDLRAHRERLAREVAEIEAKAARLRVSAEERRKTLNRIDARLVLDGNGATRSRHE